MSFQRLTLSDRAVLGLALLFLVLAACSLSGCAGQDVTIGQGEADLVFTNHGDTSVPITVRWTGADQKVITERFTVYVLGKVTLKLPDRLSYDIVLRPDCPDTSQASAADGALVQDEVIDARHR